MTCIAALNKTGGLLCSVNNFTSNFKKDVPVTLIPVSRAYPRYLLGATIIPNLVPLSF